MVVHGDPLRRTVTDKVPVRYLKRPSMRKSAIAKMTQ